jgi:hypothetical protein
MRFTKNSELDSVLSRELSPLIEKLNQRIQRTLLGPIIRNGTTSFAIRKYRKFKDLKALAVISYYIKDGYGVLLREDLREKSISQFADAERLAILLSSKEEMLKYLRSSGSDDDFFGNFLPLIKSITSDLKFLTLYPKRAKEQVRHRGYRDHGSCRPESRWLPTSDYSLTKMQNDLELERDQKDSILTSISKFGTLGVRLPELERIGFSR